MSSFIRAFKGTDLYESARCTHYEPVGNVLYICHGDSPSDIWIMAETADSTPEKAQWFIFKKASGPIEPILKLNAQLYCNMDQEWYNDTQGPYTLHLHDLDIDVLHTSKSYPPSREKLLDINHAVYRLLNTAHHMPAKRVFLDWLLKVSPYLPKVNGVTCLAELSVHYAKDNRALEIVGHMFYALIHVFGLNSAELAPLLEDLIGASLVCAPIMLERLYCDQPVTHKGLMLHALSNMTKLHKPSVVDLFKSPGTHATGFKDFLVAFATDPEFKTTERLQCLRVILSAIASSEAATDILMDTLEPVFHQLHDIPQIGTLLRPFEAVKSKDGRDEDEEMIEQLGRWWDKLNITPHEQLMLEDRIPSHCHYISSIKSQIMRVPVMLQVDKTHTSVYEATDIRDWFLVGKGRVDPDTNIPVRFNRNSLRRALQVDHVRLREIRNFVTENLELIRTPQILYILIRTINWTVIYPLRLLCREVYENGRFVTIVMVFMFAIFWMRRPKLPHDFGLSVELSKPRAFAEQPTYCMCREDTDGDGIVTDAEHKVFRFCIDNCKLYEFVHGRCYETHLSNVYEHFAHSFLDDALTLEAGRQDMTDKLQSAVMLCTMDQCNSDDVAAAVEDSYVYLEKKYLLHTDSRYSRIARRDCFED